MNKKHTIESLKAFAKKKNGACLSKKYTTSHSIYKWKCNKCNHKWEASWTNVGVSKKQTWCPKCNVGVVSWKDIVSNSRKINLKPLFNFKDYKTNSTRMNFLCLSCGNTSHKPYSSVQSGKGCNDCAKITRGRTRKNNTHSISELISYATKRGGTCLEKEYLGIDEPHRFSCKKEHKFSATAYNTLKNKSWCPKCLGRITPDALKEELSKLAQDRGGRLVTKKVTNKVPKYKFICANGHDFHKTYSKLLGNQWCPECSSGLYERICRAAFEQIFNVSFPSKNPEWLRYKNGRLLELDGYCEKIKIAFEHQGIYHYGHNQFKKFPNLYKEVAKRDRFKKRICKKEGVSLFVIPELVTRLDIADLKDFIIKEAKRLNIKLPKRVLKSGYALDFNKAFIASDILSIQKERLEEHQYEINTQSYLGMSHTYEFECIKHNALFKTSLMSAVAGGGCKECRSEKMISSNRINGNYYSFERFLDLVKKKNFTYLGEENNFSGLSIKYSFKCIRCDFVDKLSPKVLNCKQCGGKEIFTNKSNKLVFLSKSQVNNYKKVKSHCKKLKGDCLSEYFVTEKDHLRFSCASGHSWDATWANVKRGSWCPKCSATKRGKSSVIDVTELVFKKGGKYLGDFKKNNKVYRSILCKNGHKFEILTSNLTRGKWCGDCYRARRQG